MVNTDAMAAVLKRAADSGDVPGVRGRRRDAGRANL